MSSESEGVEWFCTSSWRDLSLKHDRCSIGVDRRFGAVATSLAEWVAAATVEELAALEVAAAEVVVRETGGAAASSVIVGKVSTYSETAAT